MPVFGSFFREYSRYPFDSLRIMVRTSDALSRRDLPSEPRSGGCLPALVFLQPHDSRDERFRRARDHDDVIKVVEHLPQCGKRELDREEADEDGARISGAEQRADRGRIVSRGEVHDDRERAARPAGLYGGVGGRASRDVEASPPQCKAIELRRVIVVGYERDEADFAHGCTFS